MKTLLRSLTPLAFPLALLVACGGTAMDDDVESGSGNDSADDEPRVSPDGTRDDDFDTERLSEFRSAIPSQERLRAPVPGGEPDPNALSHTGDAELANLAINSALGINAPAVLVVAVLRTITLLPPTLYDSEKQEYVWGPWDNDDGHGKAMAYIKKNDEGADFAYSYALIRMDGNDLATATPIISGGATPAADADEESNINGAGVTLWDFEANNAFEQEYDPNYDPDAVRDEGRFVMLFGKGENDDGDFKFNVAVFRDFLSKDRDSEEQEANVDYFYGHFDGNDGNQVDFVDWMLTANLCGTDIESCFENATAEDLANDVDETLGLRAAFFNRGVGRAEASITGGDLPSDIDVAECWDEVIDRTYFGVSENGELLAEEGTCAEPFAAGLAEIGIPTMADLDQEMLGKMDCVASNGMDVCIDEE